MNFIITILMFLFFSITSYVISAFVPEGDAATTFFVFGCIFGVATLVSFGAMVFGNMTKRQWQLEKINEIRSCKNKEKIAKEELEEYTNKFTESITQIYPNYEKEIFKSISPGDAEQLEIYLAKYPELKFNGVLQSHIEQVQGLTRGVFKYKRNLQDIYERIRNNEADGWYIWKAEIPAELREEIFKYE